MAVSGEHYDNGLICKMFTLIEPVCTTDSEELKLLIRT
jgi:hypothetical protein